MQDIKHKKQHRSSAVQKMIEEIAGEIRTGDLRAGEYLPSAHTLAKKYNIGYATVISAYKTLNEMGMIETVQGRGAFVRKQDVNAAVDQITVCLPSHKAFLETTNPHSGWVFHCLLAGMNAATISRNIGMNLLFIDEVGDRWPEVMQGISKETGILFVLEAPPAWVIALQRKNIPYALVFPSTLGEWERAMPCLYTDYFEPVYSAVKALLAAGRKHPVYLGSTRNGHEMPRYEGYAAALDKAGIHGEILECPNIDRYSGRVAMEKYLESHTNIEFDLLVGANDLRTLGAMDALKARGVRIPEDVMLFGFDDIPAAQEAGLSTIRLPIRELGERGVNAFLDKEITSNSANACSITIPCTTIWRGSTGTAGNE